MDKPYSPAVDRNKGPIFEVLKDYVMEGTRLLEVGSGTGQHAVFFAEKFPSLTWVTTDLRENHAGINRWVQEAGLKNIKGPEELKIGVDDFPKKPFDYVFTANTLHIMSWKEGKTLFKLLGKRLREGCLTFFYGPFNRGGEYTSESNQEFDKSLKEMDPRCGIRNFEDVVKAMESFGFKLLKDHEMPSNNRLLVFERLSK
ncbi:MAG: hypothetical protein CME68_03110 [Halobacteriovoraceae bacterium]|nr:hypothetical protein [Halobacteriovoraceae bacterium]|tara:strand:- start:543 stop:1142 length:600 start_codon:yes stop_codon:yes gene_type:complete